MHAGQRGRQHAVSPERVQRSRASQHVAGNVPEHRDDGAANHERAPARTEHSRCRFRQRRRRKLGNRRSEKPLRDPLNQQIQRGRRRQREKERARYGARRIAHLAARHQRDFDAKKCEDQHDRGPAQRGRRGECRKLYEIRVDVPEPCADEHEQRQELRHGHRLHQTRAEDDAADVHGGQHGDQRDQHDRASSRAGHRCPQRADRPGEGACDGGDGECGHQLIQHARKKADEGTERHLYVGV